MSTAADPRPGPRHVPVMLAEVLQTLAPRDGATYCDGTFGGGGSVHGRLSSGTDEVSVRRSRRRVTTAILIVCARTDRDERSGPRGSPPPARR